MSYFGATSFLLLAFFEVHVLSGYGKAVESALVEAQAKVGISCYRKTRCDVGSPGVCTIVEACKPDPSANNNNHANTVCMTMWENSTVLVQGCWYTKIESCYRKECVADPNDERDKRPYMCCCNTSNCNGEFRVEHRGTLKLSTEGADTIVESSIGGFRHQAQLYFCVIMPLSATAVAVFAMLRRFRKGDARSAKTTGVDETLEVTDGLSTSLKLVEKVAQGRFGSVWKALISTASNETTADHAAVKIFTGQNKQAWMTECDIYMNMCIKHDNVVAFLGSCERSPCPEIATGPCLVTEYCENGSVMDYLKRHVLSWGETCKIASGLAKGLAFLHEDFTLPMSPRSSGGVFFNKPSVAHRDVKSANVLLTVDLTARLADFGFATRFDSDRCNTIDLGSDAYGQVGTHRYMAPELLEGAIDYTLEAVLNVDMYACALVLWELLSRTVIPGKFVGRADGDILSISTDSFPAYALPFEHELGNQPSLDELLQAVAYRRVRPRMEDHWRAENDVRELCETIEECWEHEPTARLSASCVEQRLCHLLNNAALNASQNS